MKKVLLFALLLSCSSPLLAKHIIGGELYYTYLRQGVAPGSSVYKVTLLLFRDDYAPPDAALMPASVYIGIFNNDNNSQYPSAGSFYDVNRNSSGAVKINDFPICMVNRPNLAYHVAEFSFDVELPKNDKGYTVAFQTCCRISPIDNIYGGSSGAGSTFSCQIPPYAYSSPRFNSAIDAVCGGKEFKLDFSATNKDADSLSYEFEAAYDGGIARDASNINPSPPPYGPVAYRGQYTSAQPLGPLAVIDPTTGIISGFAPPTGRYVVTAAVTAWRKKDGAFEKITTHRKDFIINVSNCDFASVRLNPRGTYCDDFLATFENDDFSPYNKRFNWEFFDRDSNLLEVSSEERPKIQFQDTGVYIYKLVVNRGEACSDSAVASIGIYPGFKPAFNVDGQCINSEIFFLDSTVSAYGSVNTWKWDFGVSGVKSDTAVGKNPSFTYTQEGTYNVSLVVTSTMGCRDSITVPVKMMTKPEFSVSGDTLICSIDSLQLSATSGRSGAKVTWTPGYNINNPTSFSPEVWPKKTTTYYANYEESRGCNNIDSVVVKVVDRVSLKMPADTTICLTDSVLLRPVSNGLRFRWSPGSTAMDDQVKDAWMRPAGSTDYQLTASIGKCNTRGTMRVSTVPYPPARAIPDTTLCIGTSVQLSASGGSIYEWQPSVFLNNNKIANPVTSPSRSIQYSVKVNDILGCPKPSFDTITVNVIKPFVDAGPRDTAIVVDEPLQLRAVANGERFNWTPSTGLNDPGISNPVALLRHDQEYVVSVVTEGNCIAHDTIMVKVYDLKPGFYVPNAFTPNGDGLNDAIGPIAFGLKSLKYFRIYNQYGQIVFSTTNFRAAWDGTFKGVPQDAAVFAWTAEATDYTGKPVVGRGTITLIR